MRTRTAVLVIGLAALAHGEAARAQACPGVAPWVFADVQASDSFCTYLTWMAQSGVTLGCQVVDANNRLYCPDDSVTRKQMAAFMKRQADAVMPLTCAAGQVMKWNGAAWTCSDDNIGGSGGGGTVTSVLAGTGLQASPNPIVGAGSINLAPGYQLPQSCANGQVPKSNGSGGWACAADNDTNSGGTVTSVAAGAGLTGGNITSAGTLAVDTGVIQARVTGACGPGLSIRAIAANGTVTCEFDDAGTGTVTSVIAGFGLTGGAISTSGTLAVDTSVVQSRVTGACGAGSSIRAIAANGSVTCEVDDGGAANAFAQGGNAFGATAVLGTTDSNALDIRVNNSRVMRYDPNAISPNVIGGSPANSVIAGVRGATIAGGGVQVDADPNFITEGPNRVTDAYGAVGGGFGNVAGNDDALLTDSVFATVAGGANNTASGIASTVGGGLNNTASNGTSTVGGGQGNDANGFSSTVGGGTSNDVSGSWGTVGGGNSNTGSGVESTVGGGFANTASGHGSTVGGGRDNTASGDYSVALGRDNLAQGDYSIALGRRAKNLGAGSFQFADSQPFDYATAGVNNFRVRATGGVRFTTGIDAAGNGTWSCVTTDGNGWSCSSDRNLKQDLMELDGETVLAKLAAMPVYQWQPKGANAHVKHYGPMAQDFHAAFGLGDDDKMIGMQDADGVALAAIRGLNAKLAQEVAKRDLRIEALESELAALRRSVEALLTIRAPGSGVGHTVGKLDPAPGRRVHLEASP